MESDLYIYFLKRRKKQRKNERRTEERKGGKEREGGRGEAEGEYRRRSKGERKLTRNNKKRLAYSFSLEE